MARRFPDLHVQFLNVVPTGPERSIVTMRLYGAAVPAALEWLQDQPAFSLGMILERTDNDVVIRTIDTESPIASLLLEIGVVPWFPFNFEAGECRWLVLGDHGEASQIFSWLAKHGIEARTLRSGQWRASQSELTARQHRVLEEAIRLGYYEFPRRITLTALAAHLDIAKSTLSESIMVVEHKVMNGRMDGGTAGHMEWKRHGSGVNSAAGSAKPL